MASIVFLGDSITEAFPVRDLLGEYSILNKGVGGDNTDHVLARLEDDVIAHRPDAVFILIGTNDMASGFSNAKTLANYASILSRLRAALPSAAVFVQSILPTRGLENRPLERIRTLNALIRLCAAEHGAQYLDLTPLFEGDNGALAKELSDDGLHLTAPAYGIWSEYLRPFIFSLS